MDFGSDYNSVNGNECHQMRLCHCNDVIISAMASQINGLTIVYSNVYSGADQRKHQSSTSLTFVRGIHRWPVNSPHKGPILWRIFPFDDVILFWKCGEHYNGIKPMYAHGDIIHCSESIVEDNPSGDKEGISNKRGMNEKHVKILSGLETQLLTAHGMCINNEIINPFIMGRWPDFVLRHISSLRNSAWDKYFFPISTWLWTKLKHWLQNPLRDHYILIMFPTVLCIIFIILYAVQHLESNGAVG